MHYTTLHYLRDTTTPYDTSHGVTDGPTALHNAASTCTMLLVRYVTLRYIACIHTYTHIQPCMHACMHAYIHTWPGKNLQSTRTVLGVLRSILGKAGCLFLLRPMLPCKRNASILNRCGATPGSTALFRASKCLHRNELNPCFLRQSTAREPQIESAASSGAKDTLQTLGCGLSSGATSLTERTL